MKRPIHFILVRNPGYAFLAFLAFLTYLACGCSDSTLPPGEPDFPARSFLPREVPFVAVDHSPVPGEALVSWKILSWASLPIEEYLLAISTSGPVTEKNWEQARIIGRYPARAGQLSYLETLGAESGLTPDTRTWFAVRARDIEGHLSALVSSPSLQITRAWWIEGQIRDTFGNPVPNALVMVKETGQFTYAGTSGFYLAGPFRSIDWITLSAAGDTQGDPRDTWFESTPPSMYRMLDFDHVPGPDFTLIPRWGLTPLCTNPDYSFLDFLHTMTLTVPRDYHPELSILHRWDHYPLAVFIPLYTSDQGIPMDQAALLAMDTWNRVMDEPYFFRVQEYEDADIVFRFDSGEHGYGLVSLLEPAGPGVELGRVVPTRMEAWIDSEIPTFLFTAEVSLHELGHTLGLLNHADCGANDYLMKIGGSPGALSRPNPVHQDERRAVKCVRYLPQGHDMASFR